MQIEKVIARRDESLSARILQVRPLFYDQGADPKLDRPAFVRAGSSLGWVGSRLVVIQDDALFIALANPLAEGVEPLSLPAGDDGVRCFDDGRGNKAGKLDLEACVVVDDLLIAFGSGSTSKRERVVLVRGLQSTGSRPDPTIVEASELYAALREQKSFSGSEMNIEGAAVLNEKIWFFQRGNGASTGDLEPVDATCQMDLSSLVEYLEGRSQMPPPLTGPIVRYDLGHANSVPLTFTDAAVCGQRIYYLAVAEDSPDSVRDGPVAGVVIGVIEPDGEVRWTWLLDQKGQRYLGKTEGIVVEPDDPGKVYLVIDRDDPSAAAELATVKLDGFGA